MLRSHLLSVAQFLAIAASAAAACVSVSAASRTCDCQQSEFRVDSDDPQDAGDACWAALAVAAFFEELGFTKSVPITVSIVENMPSALGTNALASFTPASRLIQLLSFSAAHARGAWFGRALDRSLYRSMAGHEVAHALAWSNVATDKLSVRAREYVAYVAMFATMDPAHREAILAEVPGDGFADAAEMSEIYYYLDPSRFGVEAYRHYLRPDAGPTFLRAVLKGDELPDQDD